MDTKEPEADARPVGEDERATLRRELDEARDQRLRLLADLDNFRRRSAREHETARAEGKRSALLPMLSVVDTLERALSAGSTDQDFYEGVAATYRLLLSALREAGTEPVESEGRVFDPEVHEAVATVPSAGIKPGTVAQEVRRGWRLGDELLRPAQVVVAAAEEPADRWR